MAIYPREDARTALPQLEKKFTTMADEFSKKIDGMLDFFYPVGCYFETSDTDFDPNVKWGGTWELELAGQVHVSAGTGYSVSGAETNTSDGGNTDAIIPYHNHGFTQPKIPNHTHTGYYRNDGASGNGGRDRIGHSGAYYSTLTTVSSSGGGGACTGGAVGYAGTNGNTTNANMQPYIVVNRWHRVN